MKNIILPEFFNPKGQFKCVHLDKYRKIKGIYLADNLITNVGKNLILDVMFNDGTPIANSSWFIGLIASSGFTAVAATDIMSSHAGWNALVDYSEGTRVAWGSGAAASQSTSNSAAATFNMNPSGNPSVQGIFVTSNSTKSGTTGTLWAATPFAAPVPVSTGDQLKITYTVSA